VTLNGVIAFILRYFTEFESTALQAYYVTVIEDRPIMSQKYRLPVTFGHNWPTVQRSLSAVAELLVMFCLCNLLPSASASSLRDGPAAPRQKYISGWVLSVAQKNSLRYFTHPRTFW